MKRGQYAPEGGGGRSFHAESAIPIVLIAILAIFIAGRFGLVDLHSVPVVGSLFPSPAVKVVVVGRSSPELKTLLTAEDYRIAGIFYAGDISPTAAVPGALNAFDILVLQGSATCDRPARKAITDRVKAGGKMIVIGDACTRVTDDPNAIGWDIGIGLLGDVMPVQWGGTLAHERVTETQAFPQGRFKIIDQGHPIFSGIVNFNFEGRAYNVRPNQYSNVLAYIDSYGGSPVAPATYAIVESKGILGGNVLYYTFDPSRGTSRNMFLNTLLYLGRLRG
jgi:hypothetical protein